MKLSLGRLDFPTKLPVLSLAPFMFRNSCRKPPQRIYKYLVRLITKQGIIVTKCPKCKKELTKPKNSWAYGVFKVNAYSCDCGANFREYTNIHIIEPPSSRDVPYLEKHSFKLILKRGKWVKV